MLPVFNELLACLDDHGTILDRRIFARQLYRVIKAFESHIYKVSQQKFGVFILQFSAISEFHGFLVLGMTKTAKSNDLSYVAI